MYRDISANGIQWINISRAEAADLQRLRSEHNFHQIVIDYIASPTLHPILEQFDDYLYFILHFPIIYNNDQENQAVEVDFLVTAKALITITYDDFPQLQDIFEKCIKNEADREKYFHANTGFLLYGLLDQLFVFMLKERDYIANGLMDLEKLVFARRPGVDLVEQIANLRRDILDFRRSFMMQATVCRMLPEAIRQLHGGATVPKFVNVTVTQDRMRQLMDSHKEMIESLHDTYEALVSNRLSQIMKVLTVMSAILMSMSLLAAVWGMNHRWMPLRDGAWDFWLTVGAMAVIGLFMFILFRRKKWL